MSQPILSICIPTYNRANDIEHLLTNILEESKQLFSNELIEVVISDNASTDNTASVVESFQNKLVNLKYLKNPTNLEFDPNVINACNAATGIYCWCMGADDLISKGLLNYLVKRLADSPVDIMTLGSKTFSDYSHVPDVNIAPTVDDFIYCTSPYQFFDYCRGVLSGFIFRRSLWEKESKTDYEVGWFYYEIIFRMMIKPQLTLVYFNYPAVLLNDGCGWAYKPGGEIFSFFGYKHLLEKLPTYGYDKTFLDKQLAGYPRAMLLVLLRAKGHNLPITKKYWKQIYLEFKSNPIFLGLYFSIFIIPNFFIKWVRDLRHMIVRNI